MHESYQILNTGLQDLPTIYHFFEEAIDYIKKNNYVGWTTYDKAYLRKDVENKLQFKVLIKGEIAAVFSICFSDPIIWREMENNDALYLHRIVVNPEFKGQKLFDKILDWSRSFAVRNGLKYIRMDTWAANPNIIAYYKSFGFTHIENYTTPDTPELPDQHRNLEVALLELTIITRHETDCMV